MKAPTLDDLRRHAVARSLFTPTTLAASLRKLGFVQADPIRAPARAQDLTLRHRVKGYRAGDLERRYQRLDVEEDFFVNYGFLPRATQALMHPRTAHTPWPAARWRQARAVLDFVREHGVVHPREVDAHFQHGKARNWFGGSSNASTQLLDGMHYRGLVRTARREGGVRLYAARDVHEAAPDAAAAMDALVDVVVNKYAPLPERSLNELVSRIRYGAPQWTALCRPALARAKQRLPSTAAGGLTWYWPDGENPASRRHLPDERVRLLAPFDPVVWDRRRFEALWGWAYRFEAYTPAAQRVRGYYALPLLWRDQVVGWGNLSRCDGALQADIGFVGRRPRDAGFSRALDDELDAMQRFLGACGPAPPRAGFSTGPQRPATRR
ncbi:MAG: cytoplasmic protein [Leptothrix sp. (in: Bacteria)]|nr:cytoplasmic protein [Leptothrix sp. (in: b-proteobacteria)]